MTDVTIYGLAPSAYVRTALLTCEAKGVNYTLETVDFRSEEYRKRHPFNRMPSMRHGAVMLFETLAISTYIDEMFEGPTLQPASPLERAKMLQWVSATNDYIYRLLVGVVISERIIKKIRSGNPADEIRIQEATPLIKRYLAILDRAVSPTQMLVGETATIADFFLAPILSYFDTTPEGQQMLPDYQALCIWLSRLREEVPGYDRVNSGLIQLEQLEGTV